MAGAGWKGKGLGERRVALGACGAALGIGRVELLMGGWAVASAGVVRHHDLVILGRW